MKKKFWMLVGKMLIASAVLILAHYLKKLVTSTSPDVQNWLQKASVSVHNFIKEVMPNWAPVQEVIGLTTPLDVMYVIIAIMIATPTFQLMEMTARN